MGDARQAIAQHDLQQGGPLKCRIGPAQDLRRAGGELNLLVDSTGVKMRGEGEWQVRKHGHSRRRQAEQDRRTLQ